MKNSRSLATPTKRLAAHERRATILKAAGQLLSERGTEGVQINEVARAAGVTRPIVYKFFPARESLLAGLLSDMEKTLQEKMTQALLRMATAQLSDAVRAMVDACCDAIEEKGSGAWALLDARSSDPELAKLGAAVHARLLAPWQPLIRQHTGLKARDTELLLLVVVAAGRAALDPWLHGSASRARAVEAATRAVRALIAEFTVRT